VTAIHVTADRRVEGVDSARVWAFVADPANLERWAPVRSAGYIGTELPGVGHVVFLHRRRDADPDRAWRCRIESWNAGSGVRCSLETPGAASDQEIDLVVGTEGTGSEPAASVRITYRGRVPRGAAAIYRTRIAAMQRRAIERIFREVTTG
jgi:hypothetical protein